MSQSSKQQPTDIDNEHRAHGVPLMCKKNWRPACETGGYPRHDTSHTFLGNRKVTFFLTKQRLV